MKRIIAILCVCLLLTLTGCDDSQDSQKSNMFVYIQESGNYDIVYHRDTKVMYAISDGSYNHGTFTLLVNPDGTPMLYKEESEDEK